MNHQQIRKQEGREGRRNKSEEGPMERQKDKRKDG